MGGPDVLQVGASYRVVDGIHDGAEGVLMKVTVEGFGREYADLVVDDGHGLIRCRVVDLEAM